MAKLPMNTLVVYCHPHDGSHNYRIREAVIRGLTSAGVAHEVLDLYRDGFAPALMAAEYTSAFITRDKTMTPDVQALQQKVEKAKNLIFIYPVWWYTMPAMLKGFLDRVFTAGFAYRFRRTGRLLNFLGALVSFFPGFRYLVQPYAALGLLRGKRAYIFRTYGGPPAGRRIFGNKPAALEQVVLRFCGITRIRIYELYNLNTSFHTPAAEASFLRQAERVAAKIRNR